MTLTWDAPTDDDVTLFNIYSGTAHNFLPSDASRIGTSTTNNFVDQRTPVSNPLYYRISAVDKSGNESQYSSEVSMSLTGVIAGKELPKSYALYQSYPNPFNPSATIRFDVPKEGKVRIRVYDVRGAEIATISDESKPAGSYELTWSAQNAPSGIYFARMDAGDFHATIKMLLVK